MKITHLTMLLTFIGLTPGWILSKHVRFKFKNLKWSKYYHILDLHKLPWKYSAKLNCIFKLQSIKGKICNNLHYSNYKFSKYWISLNFFKFFIYFEYKITKNHNCMQILKYTFVIIADLNCIICLIRKNLKHLDLNNCNMGGVPI